MTIESTDIKSRDIWQALQLGRCTFSSDLKLHSYNHLTLEWGFFSEDNLESSIEIVFAPIVTTRIDLKRIEEAAKSVSENKNQTEELSIQFILLSSQKVFFKLYFFHSPNSENIEIIFKQSMASDGLSTIYQRIFDSTPDGIMVIDSNRQVRLVNQACGKLLDRDPQELVKNNCVCGQMVNCHLADGRSLNSQLCPAQSLFNDDGSSQTETMLITNSEGEERWVETTYSPIIDEHGNVDFVVGLIRDVHERKLLEEKLRQSEKLASLGQLTAGIAHEIKNPLGIILSSVEIILDENRPRDMQVEAASFIRDEVKQLDERIRAFLKFARPTEPHPEEFDINEFVIEFFKNREAKDRHQHTSLELADNLPHVFFDEDHLAQIMINLYINVFEASHKDARILARTKLRDKTVVFEIHDDGPGVPQELWKKIFDPFFTTDASGTGLGLSIVAQLAMANKGRIYVEDSKKLGGALFGLELPIQVQR